MGSVFSVLAWKSQSLRYSTPKDLDPMFSFREAPSLDWFVKCRTVHGVHFLPRTELFPSFSSWGPGSGVHGRYASNEGEVQRGDFYRGVQKDYV